MSDLIAVTGPTGLVGGCVAAPRSRSPAYVRAHPDCLDHVTVA
jgi:hypothetical protein